MRVLLTGATGLIGSAVAARLAGEGQEVVGVTRRLDSFARRVPVARWVELDLRDVRGPEDWLPHLAGIDAVVNCAGALQDSARDSTSAVHDKAPASLWQACSIMGVRRIVQISAAGVDRNAATAFMRTKWIGDQALMDSGLDWTVLRPALVIGRAAYGGSALFRALAALPLAARVRETGRFDIIEVDDIAVTVSWALRPETPVRQVLELAGPERIGFEELIATYRAWLGWRPAWQVAVPGWLMAIAFRVGDAAAWLGWRPPVRTTAWRETIRGTIADGTAWTAATGLTGRPLRAALAAEPASVQERWFARLYLLKPVAFAAFVLFWLLTAAVAAGPGWNEAVARMGASGAPAPAAAVALGIAADLAIGLLIAFRRTARLGLLLGLALTTVYIVMGSLLEPGLWCDPLGPLMKLLPIAAFNLMLLAILDER